MCNKIALIISVLLTTTVTFGSNNNTPIVYATDTKDIKRDVMVSLNAQIDKKTVYFNLVMLNESKHGVYSLVRINSDDTFISIGLIDAITNETNQRLVYSFHDDMLPNSDAQYVLYRLGDSSEQIITWKYDKENNAIYQSAPYISQ